MTERNATYYSSKCPLNDMLRFAATMKPRHQPNAPCYADPDDVEEAGCVALDVPPRDKDCKEYRKLCRAEALPPRIRARPLHLRVRESSSRSGPPPHLWLRGHDELPRAWGCVGSSHAALLRAQKAHRWIQCCLVVVMTKVAPDFFFSRSEHHTSKITVI